MIDRERTRIAVQGIWLRYKGLMIGSAHAWHTVDNAAYTMTKPLSPEDMPGPGAILVAT